MFSNCFCQKWFLRPATKPKFGNYLPKNFLFSIKKKKKKKRERVKKAGFLFYVLRKQDVFKEYFLIIFINFQSAVLKNNYKNMESDLILNIKVIFKILKTSLKTFQIFKQIFVLQEQFSKTIFSIIF